MSKKWRDGPMNCTIVTSRAIFCHRRSRRDLRLKKRPNLPILHKVNNDHSLLEESNRLYERLSDPFRMYGAVLGKSYVTQDCNRKAAAKLYRTNDDGCRDLWKLAYRQRKERSSIRS
jgi:hypothetical protein